ncbi:AlpA family phage regulatory protein [Salmonella enterica]|nr:AlpA family phage regulatory protein [Salmonella enterica subsp. enterica serovar Newport]EGF6662698.1 AlpA family phage regulatory protein [Salmonella enterica]EHH5777907.1 AlpA family phage regulatory protein [Salmonella enterica]
MTTLNTNINVSPDTLISAQDPLIDMTFITMYTGMMDKWFYKLIGDGLFPKPIKLGRSSRWKESEVKEWLLERIEQSRE